jgi:hypothetical protein
MEDAVTARGREVPRPLLLIAAFLFLLIRISRPPVVYDEGLILAGADRILLGEIPFKDFWNTHPPGQLWLVAGLFRLFGESMTVLRVYDAAVKASLALVLFDWAARLAPRPLALSAYAAAAIWLEYSGWFGFGYTAFPALLLGLLSIGWIVAAGEAPALILAVGARKEKGSARYPVEPAAISHGAGVPDASTPFQEVYARFGPPQPGPAPAVFGEPPAAMS